MSKTTTLAKPTLGGKTTSAAALAFAEAGTATEKTGAKQAAAERRAFFAPEGYRRLTINLPEDAAQEAEAGSGRAGLHHHHRDHRAPAGGKELGQMIEQADRNSVHDFSVLHMYAR
jgi:hypothetical protein